MRPMSVFDDGFSIWHLFHIHDIAIDVQIQVFEKSKFSAFHFIAKQLLMH